MSRPTQQTTTRRTFKRNAHINYFLRCLGGLPAAAQSQDPNRITIAYFCLSALDLLGALEEKTTQEQRNGWVEWIWSLQTDTGGFRGSPFMTTSFASTSPAHLPSTYTALMSLAILRAPLDRLDIAGLAGFLRSCQTDDGSFSPLASDDCYISAGFQNDVRMTYCASVTSSVIGGVFNDVDSVARFVARCQTWEGGYASRPGVVEAQGGTTYCSVAALSLLQRPLSDPTQPLRWLLQRQVGGFQGRPGKLEDVCYSFWCGAAISMLGHGLVDAAADLDFLLSAQSPLGGFGKEPEDYPDPFHSYLALAAMALNGNQGLKRLDARWNVSEETAGWLQNEVQRIKLR